MRHIEFDDLGIKISGVRYTWEVLDMFSRANGEWYEIKREGDLLIFKMIRKIYKDES
jgi:hypothetical protein